MGTGAKWFGRVVWFGIFLNLCFAIPAIFAPDMFLAGLDQPPASSVLWLQNVGVLAGGAEHLLHALRRLARGVIPPIPSL